MRVRCLAIATSLALVAAACSGAPAVTLSPASLTVYAAASLANASARLKAQYERDNPGTTLVFSADSSAALETKIEQGAPADVFLSADTTNPQKLVDKGLADGGVVVFAGNLLAIVLPTANPARIADPADLARPGVKIVACGDTVPCGRYGATLVANLAKQPGYPADYAARYAANVVSREANVTAVLNKVELGEADAGIVYVTDAKGSSRVVAIGIPDGANVPADYGAAVVKASKHLEAARAFVAWLSGTGGASILAELGFLPGVQAR